MFSKRENQRCSKWARKETLQQMKNIGGKHWITKTNRGRANAFLKPYVVFAQNTYFVYSSISNGSQLLLCKVFKISFSNWQKIKQF